MKPKKRTMKGWLMATDGTNGKGNSDTCLRVLLQKV